MEDYIVNYRYYNGEKVAPILTIFIGGNHEASNYLQELPYGGWVAPNIYYLGYAGIINIAGWFVVNDAILVCREFWQSCRLLNVLM